MNQQEVFNINDFIVQLYYCEECKAVVEWYHEGPFIMKMVYTQFSSFYDKAGHKRKIPNRASDVELFGTYQRGLQLRKNNASKNAHRERKRNELQRQRDTTEQRLSQGCYGIDVGGEAEDRTEDCRKTKGFREDWQEDSRPLPEESSAVVRAERVLRQDKLEG